MTGPTCEEETADEADRDCLTALGDPGEGASAPSPAEVAEQAIELLPLRAPEIGLAPDPSGMGLVGLPVWMWTDSTGETWGPVSRTASVSGVSVTATAEATRIDWDMGDGTVVACEGPGTPYERQYGAQPSPTCGHTYTTSSASQPDARYRITATTYWSVEWEGGGASGAESIEQSAATSLSVGEAQALN